MKNSILRFIPAFVCETICMLFSLMVFLSLAPQVIFAQSDSQSPVITIINPIRGNGLGHEIDDLAVSLKAQWQVTQEEGIRATWLMQYGALEDAQMTDIAIHDMSGQEFGLLFEIDRNFAQKSGVLFRGQGSWYFSDGLFLNSYDVGERKKFIDTAFSQFKKVFGYYPKTVGAWWIGGDSLSYMQKKYGITAALRAADQFDLDFYSLWGTPWNIPYLAAKNNEAIPAASFDDSSKVVILQWAARDPLEGYTDPLYSLQDYTMKSYSSTYVNYLADIFLNKPFDNLVIGLENGGTLEEFNKSYRNMLVKAKELEKEKNRRILLVQEYTRNYLDQKKIFPNQSYFLSNDYDSSDQSFWYISGQYRAVIQKRNNSIYVADLRDYTEKVDEDFSILPNTQARLRINAPSVIDSRRFPDTKLLLRSSSESMTIQESGKDVMLSSGKDIIALFTPEKMKIFFTDSNSEKTYDFSREKRSIGLLPILYGITCLYIFFVYRKKKIVGSPARSVFPLFIPLLFASFFLVSQSVFLFDKKETILLFLLFSLRIAPVYETLILVKILPFILLFVAHYLYFVAFPNRVTKIGYYVIFIMTVFLYMHVPYFPLDKTTFGYVGVLLIVFVVLLCGTLVFLFKKISSRKCRLMYIACTLISIGMVVVAILFSRSKLALTHYEISALQKISESMKSVVYVEQFDYAVRPIYKAVKPLLYNNIQLARVITHTPWTVNVRPSNNIIQLTDYENKYIVVPKYMGSDMSEYEMNVLQIRKIFDNAQIQIFEKI